MLNHYFHLRVEWMALITVDVNTNTFSTSATSHVLGIRTHLSYSGIFVIPRKLQLYCF